jgi:hypothetical protein
MPVKNSLRRMIFIAKRRKGEIAKVGQVSNLSCDVRRYFMTGWKPVLRFCVQCKRRDGVSPDIHSFGFTTVIRKRLFASISRVQIYQITRFKSSNIFFPRGLGQKSLQRKELRQKDFSRFLAISA